MLIVTVGSSLFVAAVGGAMFAFVLSKPLLPAEDLGEEEADVFRNDELRAAQLDKSLNILVLGTDNPDPTNSELTFSETLRGRSDTMLLVRVNHEQESINVLSIPRDTRVRIPESGITKVNVANAIGGPALAAEVVSELLGDVPIDRYVRLNTNGIAELIDVLGGVEIDVPSPMKYVDRTQALEIDLEPGVQRLSGEEAHHFLRFRQDELGDIGRVQRQQQMIRAVSEQALRPRTLLRLPDIVQTIRDNVDTNMTLDELLSLSQFAFKSRSDSLNLVMLPGRFSGANEYPVSFWIVDRAETYRVAVSYFNADPAFGAVLYRSPVNQRVAVTNASGLPRMGRNMADTLRQRGFTNVYVIQDASKVLEETAIIAQQGDAKAASEVQALIGVGEVKVESTGEISSDITVKVGRDWATYWYPESLEPNQAASLKPDNTF
ncbi:MAG: LCP family protein [Synechococcus sp.]